ncbi:MAG TPA: hypothetical protein VGN97_22700 [Mesorhizobium sp.]|nr:hypothetical protein [Mesorhizobium sp.]
MPASVTVAAPAAPPAAMPASFRQPARPVTPTPLQALPTRQVPSLAVPAKVAAVNPHVTPAITQPAQPAVPSIPAQRQRQATPAPMRAPAPPPGPSVADLANARAYGRAFDPVSGTTISRNQAGYTMRENKFGATTITNPQGIDVGTPQSFRDNFMDMGAARPGSLGFGLPGMGSAKKGLDTRSKNGLATAVGAAVGAAIGGPAGGLLGGMLGREAFGSPYGDKLSRAAPGTPTKSFTKGTPGQPSPDRAKSGGFLGGLFGGGGGKSGGGKSGKSGSTVGGRSSWAGK